MTNFEQKLGDYKQLIDADVESFADQFVERTQKEFGPYPTEAVKVIDEFYSKYLLSPNF